jgi:hypothetical protein
MLEFKAVVEDALQADTGGDIVAAHSPSIYCQCDDSACLRDDV